jgi:D-aspartate ligase
MGSRVTEGSTVGSTAIAAQRFSRRGEGTLPPAVILGLDELVGLQTARILSRRGIPVIGIAKWPRNHACRTRHVKRLIIADTYSEEVLPVLVALGKTFRQKAVLVPCIDETVLLVSRHRAELDPYFLFALPEAPVVEMLADKEQFFRFALRENLPIPKTFLVTSREEAAAAAAGIRYPCIIKPSLKSRLWWLTLQTKALIVADASELLAAYDRVGKLAKVLIVQEYIRGGEGALFSSNCYYGRGGDRLVTFIAKKIRQWPPLTGFTSLGEECRNDIVLEESNLLFGKVPYWGLGYLEVKRDEVSGEHLIIEANIGRPTGRSALAEGCGVELLYTMYCDLVGLPLPANRTQTYRGGKWIQIINDMKSAWFFWRRGELTIPEYVRSLRGIKVFAIWSLSDPLPFLFDVFWRIKHHFFEKREQ